MLVSLGLLLRSYRYHFNRCLIVILAMLVGVAGLSAVLVLNETAKRSYRDATQPLLSGVTHRIEAKSNTSLTKKDYAELRRAGLVNLVPVLSQSVAFVASPGEQPQTARFIGMDLFAILSLPKEFRNGVTDENDNISSFFANTWQQGNLLIHPDFAKELGLSAESKVSPVGSDSAAQIAVVEAQGLGRQIVTDIAMLQALLVTNEISSLFVVNGQNTAHIQSLLPEHLVLEPINSGEDAAQLTDSFHLNLMAMALLMFVVCMFVAMNALHLLLIKRLPNLKVLRQLGMQVKHIRMAMLLEVTLLSLILTPLGILLGIELASMLSPSVYKTLESLYAVRISFSQLSFLSLWIKCVTTTLAGAMIAIALPLWQLNQNLSKAKNAGEYSTKNLLWRHLFLIFSGVGGALYALTSGMLWSFIIVALLVFAGCCAVLYVLPLLLVSAKKCVPTKFPLLRWSIADSLRISSHSKIAYCAFFIAVATNIGMNMMVDSFRQATDSWLTQRLNADAYIYTESPAELLNMAQHQAPAIQLEARHTIKGSWANGPLDIYSYPNTTHFRQAMKFDSASHNLWANFQQGQGVLINQQLAFSGEYKVNSNIRFSVAGKTFDKVVAGIYFDYGNPNKQLLLSESEMTRLDTDHRMFAVFSDSPDQLTDFAEQANLLEIEFSMYKTEELLGLSMSTFDQTFSITKSLNIVTLLVAVFSLVTSILIIDMDNQRQRALMRSIGLSKLTLLYLGLGQYLTISTLVCLLAIPFGTLLSWLLINLINVQAFQWSYPLIIESHVIIWVVGLSLFTMTFGVLLSMLKKNQRSLSEETKCLL